MATFLLGSDSGARTVAASSSDSKSKDRHTWHGEVKKSGQDHPAICSLIRILREFYYSEHDIFAVRIALCEALANAYKHGNQGDPAKAITLTYEATVDHVALRVRDEGPGFVPESVPDPRSPANLSKPNGRGLMMMRHFMSWVRHNQRGNEVTFCLVRPPAS